jgi:phospholipid/cholesterol/gamma-HCH transport system substrate-binding protein
MRRGRRQGLSYFTVGLLTLLAISIGTYLGFAKDVPFVGEPFEIEAVFPSANNLRGNSPVRIAGVEVGKVTSIERVRPGAEAARVVMQIRDKGLPIHRDARLAIRPRIFLEGNFFVDVQPGSPSAPTLSDGDTIPINQTTAPVQLDQILTALQSDTREDLKTTLRELSTGLAGEGAAGYNRSIRFWRDAYRDSAIVNDATLGREPGDLAGYIRDAGTTAAALDRDPLALKSLITDLDTTARAFAVRDSQLADAVGELPRTLRAAEPALAALGRALPPLRRFAADLRPGVRSSTPTLRASLPFVREARRLVGEPELRGLSRDLRGTVPALTRLSKRSVPLLAENRRASSCINDVVIPWSSDKIEDADFPATGPVFEEAAKGLSGLAGESRTGDANGQWFRVLVAGGAFVTELTNTTMMLSDRPIMGVNPPPPAKGRSPLRTDVDCETQEAPDLRTRPAPPPAASRRAVVPASGDGRKLYDRLVGRAVRDLRRDVEARSLGKIKVLAEEATRETIAAVRAAARRVQGGGR